MLGRLNATAHARLWPIAKRGNPCASSAKVVGVQHHRRPLFAQVADNDKNALLPEWKWTRMHGLSKRARSCRWRDRCRVAEHEGRMGKALAALCAAHTGCGRAALLGIPTARPRAAERRQGDSEPRVCILSDCKPPLSPQRLRRCPQHRASCVRSLDKPPSPLCTSPRSAGP